MALNCSHLHAYNLSQEKEPMDSSQSIIPDPSTTSDIPPDTKDKDRATSPKQDDAETSDDDAETSDDDDQEKPSENDKKPVCFCLYFTGA